ncbi:hypothetical protein EEL31_08875 [Brevibacillus laterosporus]|nr:hypothetical protein [Brevibacillus laterosporus]TPG68621.1 hypothetical protein EEL31_08875 [Brevibacillus laterosporus]
MAEPAIEIELIFENGRSFKYYANVLPRVGEIIDINVDDLMGVFEVSEVKHQILREGRFNGAVSIVVSYVTVYLKSKNKK